MKKFFIFAFLLSSSLALYLIYEFNENKKKEQLILATDTYVRAFNTVYDEKKQLAKILITGLIHLGKVEKRLYEVSTNHAKKDVLRELIFKDLEPRYAKLSKMGIKQVHIHLPNNESFLRMHSPQIYGDDLTNIRPTVAYVNRFHEEIDTFEDGRINYGLRFVFPLFHEKNYVGSMEISFRASAITSSIMKQYYVLSNFFVKSSNADEKSFELGKDIYKPSHHKGYYYDMEVLKAIKEVSRKDMAELKPDTKITQQIKLIGEGESPQSLYDEKIDAIFTIIPIINKITKEHIAFLTVRSKGYNLMLAKTYTNSLAALSVLLLGITFYLLYMLLTKNNNLQHEVAKKTNELKEINEHLQELVQSQLQQIKSENERFELVLENIRDGIWDWDIKTNEVFYSSTWKSMLGFSDEELPNEFNEWQKRVHPDDLESILKKVQDNLDNKSPFLEYIFRMKHKDGNWIWIYARGKTLFDEDGKAKRMIGTHIDVSDDTNLQMKLQQLNQIIEEVHDSIVTTDLEGIIKTWNKGSEKIYGYTAQEALGMHVSKLHPKEDLEKVIESIATLKTKGFYRSEARLLTKSSQILYADLSLSVVKNHEGEVTGYVGYAKDISDRKNMELELLEQKEILDYQAHYDDLTGLPNRILLQDRISYMVQKAQRNDIHFALLFIDLDRFKHINDSLGHEIGDIVLKETAKRLKNSLRSEDTIARLSGDEFVALIEDLSNINDASKLAKKIITAITQPVELENHSLYITASIGITFFPQDTQEASNLIKFADTAMYKAKNEGRNNFQFYSKEMTEALMQRVSMESKLRVAINNEEFVIYFQPQLRLLDDKLYGMEALIRWNHPTLKLVPPNDFIPLAEETGMIVEIDKWMIKNAICQMSIWTNQGFNPGILSLNITMKHLLEADFISYLTKYLKLYNFDPTSLKIEITETQMMKNAEDIIEKLEKLHALGIKIAIDDFGTGYSSLSYLKRLPIDTLKIDKSFIMELPADTSNLKLVKTIIALGKNLDLSIVAEGVETAVQKELLLDLGCTYIQGYHYSRPLPAEEIVKFL